MSIPRSSADYTKVLHDLSESDSFRCISLHSEAMPTNIIEVGEYHKSCLNVFKQKLYQSPEGINGVSIIPIDILKKKFISRYDDAPDKKALLRDELKDFHIQVAKINKKNYKVSKFLYEKIKLGQQEKLFEIPYNSISYLKFWRYARLWDLIHYKVYLDQLLDRNHNTIYRQLKFDLKPSKISYLYERLKNKYIDKDTELNDFINAFNIYNRDKIKKVIWVNMAQNKLQVNKIGLISLIIKLQNTMVTDPKLYIGEVYDFITERFSYCKNKETDKKNNKVTIEAFDRKNLARCKSDAGLYNEAGKKRERSLGVKTALLDIENIINDMKKV
jgi:hypothetical protein